MTTISGLPLPSSLPPELPTPPADDALATEFEPVEGSGTPDRPANPTPGMNPEGSVAATHIQSIIAHPESATWESLISKNRRFSPYKAHLEALGMSSLEQSTVAETLSKLSTDIGTFDVVRALTKMKLCGITLTKEKLNKLIELFTTKKRFVQASESEKKSFPEIKGIKKYWNYLVSFCFKGGWKSWRESQRIRKQYKAGAPNLPKIIDCPRFLNSVVATKIQEVTNLSEPLHLHKAADSFQAHGTTLTQNAEHAYMLYLQHSSREQIPPASFEFEMTGMTTHHESPMHLLDPAKITALREKAVANPDARALYVLPFVLDGYIGHIVTIAIDFNNQTVCFLDSKGKRISDAQSAYPLAFRYNLQNELERIGKTCFGDSWNATEKTVLENEIVFQKDAHNCGGWVAYTTEMLLKKKNWAEAQTEMKKETSEHDFIEGFRKKAGPKLLNPAFHESLQNLGVGLQVTERPITS